MGASSSISPEVLMLGREGAGKTTFLFNNYLGQLKDKFSSTLGFNYELLKTEGGDELRVWDVGGSKLMRPMWTSFYRNIDIMGVIYVVNVQKAPRKDSAQRRHKSFHMPVDELSRDRKELSVLMNEKELEHIVWLVLFNKGDEDLNVDVKELEEVVGINKELKAKKSIRGFIVNARARSSCETAINWLWGRIEKKSQMLDKMLHAKIMKQHEQEEKKLRAKGAKNKNGKKEQKEEKKEEEEEEAAEEEAKSEQEDNEEEKQEGQVAQGAAPGETPKPDNVNTPKKEVKETQPSLS